MGKMPPPKEMLPSTQVVVELAGMGLIDINGYTALGLTPLQTAVRHQKLLTVEALLECGAKVNKKSRDGETALATAISRLYPDMVEILLNHNADPNKAHKDGEDAVHLALSSQYWSKTHEEHRLNILGLLFKKGSKSTNVVEANYYKLCRTITSNDFQAAKRLTNFLFTVNFTTLKLESPLWFAARFNRLEIAELLLKQGADPNQNQNLNRKSALMAAINGKNLQMVELLLRFNANVNFHAFDRNITPLRFAAYCGKDSGPEIMRLLLDSGAEVNALSQVSTTFSSDIERDESALHRACEDGNLECVKLLLEYGADVNLRNCKGETPLRRALMFHDGPDCVRVLLEHGADVTAVDNIGSTILHSVVDNSPSMVKFAIDLALERGIDINVRDKDGWTAIHDISCENMTEFLKHGADINILANDGSSMEHWCSDDEEEDECPARAYVKKLHFLGLEVKHTEMWNVSRNNRSGLYQQEAKQLKSQIICWNPKTTLYDVLFMNKSALLRFMRNKNLEEAFANCDKDFQSKYPCFGDILNLRYQRGTRRKKWVDSARGNLRKVLKAVIPDMCSDMIFKYVGDLPLQDFANEKFE